MGSARITPPRPVDVAALFPELAPLARPAIRLHPRPGSPSVSESSVGGPLLWPADEPWPHCDGPHPGTGVSAYPAEVRLERRRRARLRVDPRGPHYTPEERAIKARNDAAFTERLDAGPPQPAECPVPMLPVVQLYVRDIPLLRPPGEADLLQVLWCPYDHAPDNKPSTALFWRASASVGDVLAVPPDPYEADYPGYVPQPCRLVPEATIDYPHSLELTSAMQQALGDWSRWQAAGDAVDSSYAAYPAEFYDTELAVAPGWKAGGWAPWGRTDPYPLNCAVCEAQMVPLLTIASFEWDGGPGSWVPYEDQAAAATDHLAGQNPAQPTAVEVGSTDNLQLYVCPASAEHPHTDLIQ
ncbi:hypothetical protein [Streptomyces sp. NPDC001436]